MVQTYLFTALKDSNKLKRLHIECNAITDDAIGAITAALKRNSSLVRLYMYNNLLTNEAIVRILNALMVNNTMELIGLIKCSEGIKKTINSLQEIINKNRESRGYQINLRIQPV